jgi:hypothetical protein
MSVGQQAGWELSGETEMPGENLPSAILSTANPTWTGPGSNTGHRGGKPATDSVNYDTNSSLLPIIAEER